MQLTHTNLIYPFFNIIDLNNLIKNHILIFQMLALMLM